MLSKPSFDDASLAQSFYQALLQRFCDAFEGSVRVGLENSSFGIAPSPSGIKTFFIVTPSLEVAEELIQQIDAIIAKVMMLMAGVSQTAICIAPPQTDGDISGACKEMGQVPAKFVMGKIFSHPVEPDENN